MSTKLSAGRVRSTYQLSHSPLVGGQADARESFARAAHWRRFSVQPSRAEHEPKGNCWDNAVAESFFSSVKKDRIKKQIYKNPSLALNDVADYIDRFYNQTRRTVTWVA